jgi:hypothetical protein
MPKPDGTITFEEWLIEEAKNTQFDEGDTPGVFHKLGEEFLEEELQREEDSRLRRLRKRSKKRPGPYSNKKEDEECPT